MGSRTRVFREILHGGIRADAGNLADEAGLRCGQVTRLGFYVGMELSAHNMLFHIFLQPSTNELAFYTHTAVLRNLKPENGVNDHDKHIHTKT